MKAVVLGLEGIPAAGIRDAIVVVAPDTGASVLRSVVLDRVRIERWHLESSLLRREVSMRGTGPENPVAVTFGQCPEVVG